MGEDVLSKRLSTASEEALTKLCSLGCDSRILRSLFVLLSAKPILIPRGKGSFHEIFLHPLDSLDTALAGSDKIDIRALERTAQRTRKLLEEIEWLRKTPLVAWLVSKSYIQPHDLLFGVPGLSRSSFDGLLNLPKFAKQVGARERPDFNRQLGKIYKHIYDCTGGWHDSLVLEILYDLFPPSLTQNRAAPTTAESLIQWRRRHKDQIPGQ